MQSLANQFKNHVSLSIFMAFLLISQLLNFVMILSLHPLTFSHDFRPLSKDQMYVLKLMDHLVFSTLVSFWLSCHGFGCFMAFRSKGHEDTLFRSQENGTACVVIDHRSEMLMWKISGDWSQVFRRRNWDFFPFGPTLTTWYFSISLGRRWIWPPADPESHCVVILGYYWCRR